MIVLSRDTIDEMVVDAVICPIMGDFCFESHYSHQIKERIKDIIDFSNHQRSLIMKNIGIGENFFFSFENPNSFGHIYYLVVQNFLKKPSFRDILFGLQNILLHACDKGFTSIAIPPFLSLGEFEDSIDLDILKEGVTRASELNANIEKMKMIIPETKEKFVLITQELASLPSNLFRADRFGVRNNNYGAKPYNNRSLYNKEKGRDEYGVNKG